MRPSAMWVLQPTGHVEVLAVPRKEWKETVVGSSRLALVEQHAARAEFFQECLQVRALSPHHPSMPLLATASTREHEIPLDPTSILEYTTPILSRSAHLSPSALCRPGTRPARTRRARA